MLAPTVEASGLLDVARLKSVALGPVICSYELDAIQAPEFIAALRAYGACGPFLVVHGGELADHLALRCREAGASFVLSKTSLVSGAPPALHALQSLRPGPASGGRRPTLQ